MQQLHSKKNYNHRDTFVIIVKQDGRPKSAREREYTLYDNALLLHKYTRYLCNNQISRKTKKARDINVT